MKNRIGRWTIFAAFFALITSVFFSPLPALAAATPQPPVLQDVNGVVPSEFAPNLDFLGALPYYIESSTNSDQPILHWTGSGIVYDVVHTSGTVGDYCLFLDSNTVSSITVNTNGKAITPSVLTSANNSTGCTGQGVCGSWIPKYPKRVTNGLVGIKHGSNNSRCIVWARKDSDNAAAPPITQ